MDLDALEKQLGKNSLESKSTLITGGAGFIGSWLCDILVSSGALVTCVDNLSTGLRENVGHLLQAKNFTFREFDVTQLVMQDEEYDLIFHFASRASPEEYQRHPIETLLANSQGTQNMLDAARKHDAAFIYASTSEVYGEAEQVPTPESYWGNVNPIGSRSCYDEGKRYGEAVCMAYKRTYGLDVRIIRIFNTHGPRIRADGAYARAVSRFITKALDGDSLTVYGDGKQTRSFAYVSDTLTGILKVATTPQARGEVFNIGNPNEITILNLAQKIRELTRSNSPIVHKPLPPDDPRRRCPDISKAKKILGWSPAVSLEEGIGKTIAWFRERHAKKDAPT